jgi:hypothetical protein
LPSINRPENWSICSYLLTIILQSKMVQISFKIDECDQQQTKWLTFWIWQRFKACFFYQIIWNPNLFIYIEIFKGILAKWCHQFGH